jgi:hypothetical protein
LAATTIAAPIPVKSLGLPVKLRLLINSASPYSIFLQYKPLFLYYDFNIIRGHITIYFWE